MKIAIAYDASLPASNAWRSAWPRWFCSCPVHTSNKYWFIYIYIYITNICIHIPTNRNTDIPPYSGQTSPTFTGPACAQLALGSALTTLNTTDTQLDTSCRTSSTSSSWSSWFGSVIESSAPFYLWCFSHNSGLWPLYEWSSMITGQKQTPQTDTVKTAWVFRHLAMTLPSDRRAALVLTVPLSTRQHQRIVIPAL